MAQRNLFILFILAAVTAADLYLAWTASPARLYTKPLLMPLLALAYFRSQDNSTVFSRLIIAALFFSWIGDILLMFDAKGSLFFILGLGSFLTAHILYIIYFSKIRSAQTSFLKKRPVMLLVIIAYALELLYILWPSLDGMKIPVVIYAIVISTMLAAAAWQYGKISNRAATFFLAGALLFVLSDSALALNMFVQPYPWGGLFVMTTYVLAQTLIALGSITHLSEDSRPLHA